MHQSKQVLAHTKSSDSDFAPDLSAAGLRIRILGGELASSKIQGASKPMKLNPHIMKLETLKDLYIQELKDHYSAE
ncbi:MAG: hypothetical protein WCC93_14465, partial [Chthoniobacterales bacterium]